VGESTQPAGWHYLRQAATVAAADAPQGGRYLSFANEQPGRSSQALQGFAVDGRKISQLRIASFVRGVDLAADPNTNGGPAVIVSFFDDRRAAIDHARLGPWNGSFDWRRDAADVPVPLAAREAIFAIGLHGATGRLDIDDLTIAEPEAR
jgi:protein-L-isoaspartate(D-aspartate) O-methyltransferase